MNEYQHVVMCIIIFHEDIMYQSKKGLKRRSEKRSEKRIEKKK